MAIGSSSVLIAEARRRTGLEDFGDGEGTANIPGYSEWFCSCAMEPAYRFHERVLKLLRWRCPPNRWRLKSPTHMLTLDALVTVYPDARFVMPHRDPASVIPSVCSLVDTLVSMFSDHPDRDYVGRHWSEIWALALAAASLSETASGRRGSATSISTTPSATPSAS